MNPFTSIDTSRLRLRRIGAEDATDFLSYRNDSMVARYQSWETTTAAEFAELIQEQSLLQPGMPGTWFQFAVTLQPELLLIGDCGLYVDSADPRLGEVGFTFAPSHQGHGFATEAVRAVLRFAFEELGLHRVKAVVDRRNDSAVRLLRRVGMREEALFLQHVWFKGEWCDEYNFAMLAEEWRSPETQLSKP